MKNTYAFLVIFFYALVFISFVSTFAVAGPLPTSVESPGFPFRLECVRSSSGWIDWPNGTRLEAPMPDNFIGGTGVSCLVDFYDTNNTNTGASLQYHGAQASTWELNRTNCFSVNNDGGISKGQVTAEYCRVVGN